MNAVEQSPDEQSAAVILGSLIRSARHQHGWTIAELADKLGRPREWLNRVELGYSEYGEYRPASSSDLQTIIDLLGDHFDGQTDRILTLGQAAEADFDAHRAKSRSNKRNVVGKLTQTEIIIGEKQIVTAIVDLIAEQHSDAIIRNTGVKSLGNYHNVTRDWKQYREALGSFLDANPNSLFKRVEYAASPDRLEKAKEADVRLAGTRKIKDVHNVRLKFHKHNPMQLHVIIGQREALLALPQTSGQAGSNIALLIRDKIFVEALRVWYDEVLWNAPGESMVVNFSDFDGSFEEIKDMYDFSQKLNKKI